MAKQTGLGQRLYVGSANLSGDTMAINRISGGPAVLDMTDITESAYERQGGERDGGIDVTSFFNATRAHLTYSTLPRTDTLVTVATPSSNAAPLAIGDPAASCLALQIGYDATRNQDGTFTLSVITNADGYGLEWGQLLTAAERTDTTATNGAALANTAATNFGLQAYCHLTAFTGTNVTVKLQDSADNATFADISGAGFTAFTGVGFQRLSIANNATVRRYVRVATTGTFTSATFVVNFVRNQIAGQVF